MTASPTSEGFRAVLHRPSFTMAEIAWRWTAGATAVALFFFGLFEYLDTLPVSKSDVFLLRTRQPSLVAQALSHILHGSMGRGVAAGLLGVLLLTLFWIVAASLGRVTTVRSLLDYFRRDVAGSISAESATSASDRRTAGSEVTSNISAERSSIRSLFRLNFLRAIAALAAVVGFFGAMILAGFASPDADPRPGLAFLLFLMLAAIVVFVWGTLNWFLSLAGMFAVRDGSDAMAAISSAVSFFRERTAAIFGVSLWTGLGHMIASVGATMAVSLPLGLAAVLPWRAVVFGMLIISLAYFAVADWLYMARLAGYVCIAEMPEALFRPRPLPIQPASPIPTQPQVAPLQTTIDKDEPILSDIPTPPPNL